MVVSYDLYYTTTTTTTTTTLTTTLSKPGKDEYDPNNYRPIALTSCIRKTMERMVNDRLVGF